MLLIAGVAALVTAGAVGGTDVDALEQLWPGVRDSSEEVFLAADTGVTAWAESSEHRVRTVVQSVQAPWLGTHVLYLEEFLHDDPEHVRRQLLLQLEPAQSPATGVRVHLFTFANPRQWVHLNRRPKRLERLRRAEIAEAAGCDLVLQREGGQFTGGTTGRGCVDQREGPARYVDYQLVISEDLYWYRRRVQLKADNEVQQEVFGFNWFELNEARLFSCRIDWSPSGSDADLRPLMKLDVHDQGGHGHFVTPDGRKLELALHSQDWPFMADRDALILLLQDQDENAPLASAWSAINANEIGVNLGWLQVRCGAVVPETEEMWSSIPIAPRASVFGSLDQRVDVAQQDRVEGLRDFHHQEMPGVRHHFRFEIG
jgi:hypothetical protein